MMRKWQDRRYKWNDTRPWVDVDLFGLLQFSWLAYTHWHCLNSDLQLIYIRFSPLNWCINLQWRNVKDVALSYKWINNIFAYHSFMQVLHCPGLVETECLRPIFSPAELLFIEKSSVKHFLLLVSFEFLLWMQALHFSWRLKHLWDFLTNLSPLHAKFAWIFAWKIFSNACTFYDYRPNLLYR